MLNFEEKLAIIDTFPELERVNVSLGRVNYQFKESKSDKKNVVYHLHPNGNGFVYAGKLPNYDTDQKGMVNIRDFSAQELKQLIRESIKSLAIEEIPAVETAIIGENREEKWVNADNQNLMLVNEDETWNIYFGQNFEGSFNTYEKAEIFLIEEGFRKI